MIIISLRIFIMKALSYYCATEGWGLRDRLPAHSRTFDLRRALPSQEGLGSGFGFRV